MLIYALKPLNGLYNQIILILQFRYFSSLSDDHVVCFTNLTSVLTQTESLSVCDTQ